MADKRIDDAKRGNLGQALLRSARLYDELAFARFAKDHPEIRRSHLRLMPHIDLDGTRQNVVAQRADISKQAVAQLVDDLEAAGYVRRVTDPTDRRAKLVVFTEQGRKGIIDGLGVFATLQKELAGHVGAAVVKRLVRDLQILQKALENHNLACHRTE